MQRNLRETGVTGGAILDPSEIHGGGHHPVFGGGPDRGEAEPRAATRLPQVSAFLR